MNSKLLSAFLHGPSCSFMVNAAISAREALLRDCQHLLHVWNQAAVLEDGEDFGRELEELERSALVPHYLVLPRLLLLPRCQ